MSIEYLCSIGSMRHSLSNIPSVMYLILVEGLVTIQAGSWWDRNGETELALEEDLENLVVQAVVREPTVVRAKGNAGEVCEEGR